MLVETIQYVDPFTSERKEFKARFALSEVELLEMEAGGLAGVVERIQASEDNLALIEQFKELILMCYGERDGDLFVKNERTRFNFEHHPAFPVLFMRMAQDDEYASHFVLSVVPESVRGETRAKILGMQAPKSNPEPPSQDTPPPPPMPWTKSPLADGNG